MLTVRGDRIFLRPLVAADATSTYASWLNDPEVNRYLEVRRHAHSVQTCRAFIEATNAAADQHLFGIFLNDSGQHIGNIKIGFVNAEDARAQIGLLIGEKALWGRGYAKDAIRLATAYAFEQLGLERLEAGCYEQNLYSLRAFMHVGYSVEGFLRRKYVVGTGRTGSFLMGILKDEWARSHG